MVAWRQFPLCCVSDQGGDPAAPAACLARAAKGVTLRQPLWRQQQRDQELRQGTATSRRRGGAVSDLKSVLLLLLLQYGVKCHGRLLCLSHPTWLWVVLDAHYMVDAELLKGGTTTQPAIQPVRSLAALLPLCLAPLKRTCVLDTTGQLIPAAL